MASTIFKRLVNNRTRNRLYSAETSRSNRGLPKVKHTTAADQMELTKGDPYQTDENADHGMPTGTDRKTPGYNGSR